jgi:hypothetical protein
MSNKMRWIPVTERMPNEGNNGDAFFITIANNGHPMVSEATWTKVDDKYNSETEDYEDVWGFAYEDYSYGEFSGYIEVENVIAWMPYTYPDPYIPEEG